MNNINNNPVHDKLNNLEETMVFNTPISQKNTETQTRTLTEQQGEKLSNAPDTLQADTFEREFNQNKFMPPKPSKKIFFAIGIAIILIGLVFGGICLLSKPNYTISADMLKNSPVSGITPGEKINLNEAFPLNLPARNYNIAIDKPDADFVELVLWDFTDTNDNKIALYIDNELSKKGFTLTDKPVKIKVPLNTKIELIQTQANSSTFTPYAVQVNGNTYFNKLSSETSNVYHILTMEEKENLTLEDFK